MDEAKRDEDHPPAGDQGGDADQHREPPAPVGSEVDQCAESNSVEDRCGHEAHNAEQLKWLRESVLATRKSVIATWTLGIIGLTASTIANVYLYSVSNASAEAANASAKAALAQASLMKTALEAESRAWVLPRLPVGVEVKCDVAPSAPEICVLAVPVGYVNYGKSPALNMGSWFEIKREPTFRASSKGTALVPPGTEHPVTVPKIARIKRIDVEQITDGITKIYIGGQVLYDDVVGTDRATTWCARYSPPTKDFVYCDVDVDGVPGIVVK